MKKLLRGGFVVTPRGSRRADAPSGETATAEANEAAEAATEE